MIAALWTIDWSPMGLSCRVAAAATLLAFVVGLPLAWLLARRAFPGRDLVEAITTLPLVLPPTVLGYYLLVAFGRHAFLGRLYQSVTGSALTFTIHGAVAASLLHALPLVVRTARAGIEQVDRTLEDAARTLGAGELRVAALITLPLARPAIVAAGALAFARALGDFGVTLMVAGDLPGETRTAALAIYDAMEAGRDAEAGALVVVLTAIAVAALYVVGRFGGARREQ
jgi:molybdate transport system permease protein